MFHWRTGRRLPREIELEVETLIADLRGVPFRLAEETVSQAPSGRRMGLRSLSRFLPLAKSDGLGRRSVGSPGADDRR